MPAKKLSIRKIKEVVRLKRERGLSNRQVATACGISRPSVSEYLRRAAEAGLAWPLPEALSEAKLEQRLFPPPPDLPAQARGIPDWKRIHDELRGKNVTLFLLWQEYRESNPDGYQYSWFCDHYRAGGKLFVDYAGQTVPVIDRTTGEIHEAQVFVAVMGASNYTYAEATWSQPLPDWIGSPPNQPRQGRRADPGRLGADEAERREPKGLAGGAGRPTSPALHHRHKPITHRGMAWRNR